MSASTRMKDGMFPAPRKWAKFWSQRKTLSHFRFVFHNKEGNPISKTSYDLHLKRACDRHNIEAINNLAFRIAFISRLIEKDLSPAD